MHAFPRVTGLSDFEQAALNELVAQWEAKRAWNTLRSGFYDMQYVTSDLMPENAPPSIKQRKFVLGWPAIAVDKLNRRCNLDGFYVADGTDLGSLGLDELIRSNRLLGELSQAGASCLIHSVAFLVTMPGDPSRGEPRVLILAKDARSATGMWDVRRRGLRSFLSIDSTDKSGAPTAMTMFLPNLTITFHRQVNGWAFSRRGHQFGLPVDVMRYKPRLAKQYGVSRISEDVMSITKQATAAMIRADVNGEAYSLPRYAWLGVTEESFKNPDGTQKAAWRAAWDAMWMLGDDPDAEDPRLARADVKQFLGQSPEPQNAQLRMLAQQFSATTGVPIGELGIMGDANPTSAAAHETSRDDIVSEAEKTMDEWTPDISATVTRALRMLSGEGVPEVTPFWRNPLHISRAAAADSGSKVIAAMPWLAETEVGMEMMGMTRSQIARALVERRRSQSRALLADLVAAGERE